MRRLAALVVLIGSTAVLSAQIGTPRSSSPAASPRSSLLGPAVDVDPTHVSTPHLSLATSARTTGPAKATLVVDVAPKASFHIYAPGAKDYRPLTVRINAPAGVTLKPVEYPKSESMLFDDERVPVYAKPFVVVQDVTLDAVRAADLKAGRAITVTGTMDYQACDERICYKAASVPLAWTLSRD